MNGQLTVSGELAGAGHGSSRWGWAANKKRPCPGGALVPNWASEWVGAVFWLFFVCLFFGGCSFFVVLFVVWWVQFCSHF